MPVDKIRVGERHRKDMGDIAGLAASMAELRLLHPIVVRPDGTLIAGERRLRAGQLLGWKTSPSPSSTSMTSCAASSPRTPIARTSHCPRRSRSSARWSRSSGRRRRNGKAAGLANSLGNCPIKGRAADKAAKATGMARRTLEKAEAVVDAAEAEPEKFGKLLADMDRTGRVNGAYRRLKMTAGRADPRRAAAAARQRPLSCRHHRPAVAV